MHWDPVVYSIVEEQAGWAGEVFLFPDFSNLVPQSQIVENLIYFLSTVSYSSGMDSCY